MGKPFAASLFVIVALTFAAAYYVPLYRTHTKLVAEYGALAQRVSSADAEAAKAKTDLAAAHVKIEALSAAQKTDDPGKAQRAALLARAEKDVREKIGSESTLSATRRGERVVVRVGQSALKTVKDHVEVSSGAITALCDALSAVTASSLGFTVVARVGSGAGKKPWESAGARAASVAQVIEKKCGVSADRLAATGRLATDSDGSIDVQIGALAP